MESDWLPENSEMQQEEQTAAGEGEAVQQTEGSGAAAAATTEQEAKDQQRRSVFNGYPLETYTHEPEGEIKAVVCLCHGVLEHFGRYEMLVDHLTANGVAVFGMDLVGHGNSGGVRGHVDDIQSFVSDNISLVEDMKEKYPSYPMFLMGHSMGGLIATMIAIQRADLFNGLLLSSPFLMVNPDTAGPLKIFLVKLLASIAPRVGVLPVDPEQISSIPEEVEAYINDPLIIHTPMKAGITAAMLRALDAYEPRLGEINMPLFVMHGTGDQIVPISASELVYNNASSTDKTYEIFTDSFHEILHDREQARARETIGNWILARLRGTAVAPAATAE